MSNEIVSFLEALKDCQGLFEVKKHPVSSELEKIVSMQIAKDVNGLLKVWEQKLEKGFFELPHPDNEKITTRAVYSIRYGMANYVFMNDSTNSYPWVFGQCVNFIDIVVTKDLAYSVLRYNNNAFKKSICKLSEVNINKLKYEERGFCLWVSQSKPYHFFYDQLKFLLSLKIRKRVCFKDSFFAFDSFDDTGCADKVLLFPTVIGNNFSRAGTVSEMNAKMEKLVYEDAIKDCKLSGSKKGVLKLWYGITGQKRSWLEQVEGIENLIQKLVPYFDEIEIYIDGMTALEGTNIKNSEDEAIFEKILQKLEFKCKVFSLVGQDYRRKIQVCCTVDLFISNAGTGCIVPLRFCKKPGVLHSNTKLFSFPDEYPSTVKKIDKRYTINVLGEEESRADFASYHIPWQHIFNLVVEVINKVKGIEIEMLEVPSVDEVAKSYSAQESVRREKINSFYNIEQRIKPGQKSPDILREVALSFEESGEIETALKVMKKALELRPEGPFIKKKIDKYHQILQERGRKL